MKQHMAPKSGYENELICGIAERFPDRNAGIPGRLSDALEAAQFCLLLGMLLALRIDRLIAEHAGEPDPFAHRVDRGLRGGDGEARREPHHTIRAEIPVRAEPAEQEAAQ